MATDVAAGFPQVDLTPLTIITVTLDDPGATITSLAVHGYQDDATGSTVSPSPVTGAYTSGGVAV